MKRNNNNKKYGYEQQQTQIQETAHEMELVIDIFHTTFEVLEEYIGKLNHYPNWNSRRQLYRKKIVNSDYTLEGFEDIFLTQLLIAKASVVNKPEFFRKEVQKEFHKWINATGIDKNNCPERLKHFLFEINEILEGRGENIVNQTRELIRDRELTTDEALGFFGKFQGPMNKNRERGSLLEGKNWDEAENRNEIGGSFEQGERTFGQISQGFASEHANFDLFSEQKKVRRIQSSHPTNLNEVVQDVKTNSQNWTLDEIPTEINNLGWERKKEPVIYCRHARLDEYDQQGKLNFNNNPIYRWESFNSWQRFEIKKAKNISGDYLTNEEIKWVVREVKDNPRVWRVELIKGHNYLIHNSAEIKDNEVGTLIHNQQKFSREEWAEVGGEFERISTTNQPIRWELINKIKQRANEFRNEKVMVSDNGQDYNEEVWIIHNSVEMKSDKNGCLVFDPNKMVKVKDLTEAEQKAVGYKSEAGLQTISITPKNDDKGIGKGGIIAIIGVVGAFTIAGIVVAKKKLNKKVKKV